MCAPLAMTLSICAARLCCYFEHYSDAFESHKRPLPFLLLPFARATRILRLVTRCIVRIYEHVEVLYTFLRVFVLISSANSFILNLKVLHIIALYA